LTRWRLTFVVSNQLSGGIVFTVYAKVVELAGMM
jgi:hypothetical protein